jgi:hypothetical protein
LFSTYQKSQKALNELECTALVSLTDPSSHQRTFAQTTAVSRTSRDCEAAEKEVEEFCYNAVVFNVAGESNIT